MFFHVEVLVVLHLHDDLLLRHLLLLLHVLLLVVQQNVELLLEHPLELLPSSFL